MVLLETLHFPVHPKKYFVMTLKAIKWPTVIIFLTNFLPDVISEQQRVVCVTEAVSVSDNFVLLLCTLKKMIKVRITTTTYHCTIVQMFINIYIHYEILEQEEEETSALFPIIFFSRQRKRTPFICFYCLGEISQVS